METGECDWSKSAWTGRMSKKSCGWPQGRVRAMRQTSLIPSSPSEESDPDTVNASRERSADTVTFCISALFRDAVEVAPRGSDALGGRREGVRRSSSDPILCGRPA